MVEETPPSKDLEPIPVVTSAVDVPTIYADSLMFATKIGSNIRLNFAEAIIEPEGTPSPGMKSRHAVTVVLPPEGFISMMKYLEEITPKYIFPDDARNAE